MSSDGDHPKPRSPLHLSAVGLAAAAAAVSAVAVLASPYDSGRGWLVLALAASGLALLPKRALKGFAPLYGATAICWAALDYLDRAYELTSGLEWVAAALTAASGLLAFAFTATLFTRSEATRSPWVALVSFPATVAALVGWALVPVSTDTPTVTLPTTFQATIEIPDSDEPLVFTVDDGQVTSNIPRSDPTTSAAMLSSLTLPLPLFANDGTIPICHSWGGLAYPGLAAYTWSREGDVLVGTITNASLRAGTVTCDDSLRSRLAARYLAADTDMPGAIGGRAELTMENDVLHHIDITQSSGDLLRIDIGLAD